MSGPHPAPSTDRAAPARELRFGDFRFDPSSGILARGDEEISLPPKVLGVLAELLAQAGGVVGKEHLLDAVWGTANVSDRSLSEAVRLLRQALGDDPQDPEYIRTIHRRGYRFIAAVEAIPTGATTPARAGAGGGATPAAAAITGFGARPIRIAALAIAAVVVGLALRPVWIGSDPSPLRSTLRLSVAVPPHMPVSGNSPRPLTVSPDGTTIVYVAQRAGLEQLVVKRATGFDAAPLPGTERAFHPWYSPAGDEVGFFVFEEGRLQIKRLPLDAEAPVTVGSVDGATAAWGATWSSDGHIYFVPDWSSGLWRVRASGGAPEQLMAPDPARDELGFLWPQAIPDHDTVLVIVNGGSPGGESNWSVVAIELDSGRRTVLVPGSSYARYVPPGYLVFTREDGLHAARIDPALLAVGDSVPLMEEVREWPGLGAAELAVASNGTLAYVPRPPASENQMLVVVDAFGRDVPLSQRTGQFAEPALSPDRRRLLVTVHTEGTLGSDIWLYDLSRDSFTRLTFDAATEHRPIWTPDGTHVTFAAASEAGHSIVMKPPSPEGQERVLIEADEPIRPADWSPDGRVLVYERAGLDSFEDLWALTPGDPLSDVALVVTPNAERQAVFSPDGTRVAYATDRDGRFEIYVKHLDGTIPDHRVSDTGGHDPRWGEHGAEILYRREHEMRSVRVDAEAHPAIALSRLLFTRQLPAGYDYEPERSQFVMMRSVIRPVHGSGFHLVLGWIHDVESRLRAAETAAPR